jgi:hypothetical protein
VGFDHGQLRGLVLHSRSRFPALLRGTALFEDIRVRQCEALDIHDSVVQGLAVAKLSLDLGRVAEATAAVEKTLAASRKIITDLLGDSKSEASLGPRRPCEADDRFASPDHGTDHR